MRTSPEGMDPTPRLGGSSSPRGPPGRRAPSTSPRPERSTNPRARAPGSTRRSIQVPERPTDRFELLGSPRGRPGGSSRPRGRLGDESRPPRSHSPPVRLADPLEARALRSQGKPLSGHNFSNGVRGEPEGSERGLVGLGHLVWAHRPLWESGALRTVRTRREEIQRAVGPSHAAGDRRVSWTRGLVGRGWGRTSSERMCGVDVLPALFRRQSHKTQLRWGSSCLAFFCAVGPLRGFGDVSWPRAHPEGL